MIQSSRQLSALELPQKITASLNGNNKAYRCECTPNIRSDRVETVLTRDGGDEGKESDVFVLHSCGRWSVG